MGFQDALYTLEVGKGRRVVQVSAIIVGFIFLALLYYLLIFRGFNQPAAFDSAQLGRQLAQGQGFTTKFIRPAAVREYNDYRTEEALKHGLQPERININAFPDISNSPGYPTALSVIFRLAGTKFDLKPSEIADKQGFPAEKTIIIFNQFCVFLTALILFIWTWRMFDDRVAFVATIAFVGCDLIWRFAISGLSTCWVMLLLTAAVATIHETLLSEEEDRRGAVWIWTLLSAVLLTAAILSRMVLAWLLIPYAVLLLFSLRRLVFPPMVAILIVLIGIIPWYARNYAVCHNPFGSNLSLVNDTGSPEEAAGERAFNPASHFPVKHGLVKIYTGFSHSIGNFFILGGTSATVLLFVAAFLHRFKRSRTQYMRWFLIGSAFFIVLGGSLLWANPNPGDEGNNLILLFPGVAAFGAAFFYVLLDRLEISLQIVRYIVVTIFVLICIIPQILSLIHPNSGGGYSYPPYSPPMLCFVSQMLQPQELLVSDVAPATAWYGNHASLWLPATLKEFYDINDGIFPASGMLLTPLSWDRSLYIIDKGPGKEWAPLIRRQGLPTGFPLSSYTAMPPMENEYLFFSDRRRW